MSNILSIFIDESGSFGRFEPHSPYYLFSLVFHDQSKSIADQAQKLEDRLIYSPFPPSHCFHTMPIIRKELDYLPLDVQERRKLLGYLVSFTRSLPISYTSFIVEKNTKTDVVSLTFALSRKLSEFVLSNHDLFDRFDRTIVYYDNGQTELTRILVGVLGTHLLQVEFRKVEPSQYRLFQVADLCCTMELISFKVKKDSLSKSEIVFFGNNQSMNKNYLRPVFSKRLKE